MAPDDVPSVFSCETNCYLYTITPGNEYSSQYDRYWWDSPALILMFCVCIFCQTKDCYIVAYTQTYTTSLPHSPSLLSLSLPLFRSRFMNTHNTSSRWSRDLDGLCTDCAVRTQQFVVESPVLWIWGTEQLAGYTIGFPCDSLTGQSHSSRYPCECSDVCPVQLHTAVYVIL